MNVTTRNFAETFCERHGIALERFPAEMLRRALYPHARFILPVWAWFDETLLEADRELVLQIGSAETKDHIRSTLSRMPLYYGESWNSRQRGRLRISSRRVMELWGSVMDAA